MAGQRKKRPFFTIKRRDALCGLLFMLPWIVGFCLITAYPFIYSLHISFNQVVIKPGLIEFEPMGWEFYRAALLSDTEYPVRLMSSLASVLLGTPVSVVFALVIALLLNNKFRGRGLLRVVFFLPVIIMSGPVMSELLTETAAMRINVDVFGVLGLLQAMEGNLASILITFLNSFVRILWFTGVQTIVFLAVLQKVDRAMYEAASIDGATVWESFWRITLPYLRPSILLCTVYTIVEIGTFSDDPTNQKIVGSMRDITRPYSYSAAMSWIYAVCLLMLIGLGLLLLSDWKEIRRSRHERQR